LVIPNSGATRPAPAGRTTKRAPTVRSAGNAEKEVNDSVMDNQDQQADEGEQESNEVTRDMKLDFVNKIKKLSNAGLTSLV